MLCFNVKGFSRACTPVTGGISDIVVFDPDDFNFTQGAPIGGVNQPYSAVALRSGAVGTGATAPFTSVTVLTVGTDGNYVKVYTPVAFGAQLIASITKTSAETTAQLLAVKIANAINAGTSGWTAGTPSTGTFTLTAPASYGANGNGLNVVIDDMGDTVVEADPLASGVTGTGGKMYNITFLRDEADWQWKQSTKGCSVKYEHTFTFQLPDNSQNLTTFLEALDAASCCCGLGMIVRLNTGKIVVCGEKWVNGDTITRFTVLNNGSSGGSGKLYDDFNGGTIVLTGPYSRSLYEFSGAWAGVLALM